MNEGSSQVTCPKCGAADPSAQGGPFNAPRVCRFCRTRFHGRSPRGWEFVVAAVFLIPGVVFGAVAVGIALLLQEERGADPGAMGAGLLCFGVFAALALGCLAQSVREVRRRDTRP